MKNELKVFDKLYGVFNQAKKFFNGKHLLKPIHTFPDFLNQAAFIAPYYEQSLDDVIIEGNLNEDWARQIAKGLCHGLIYMHGLKIPHRDIKTHNIMINNEG